MVPTRRRVHVRNPDGTPVPKLATLPVDMIDISFR
jgi:hypothetical protein